MVLRLSSGGPRVPADSVLQNDIRSFLLEKALGHFSLKGHLVNPVDIFAYLQNSDLQELEDER